MDEQFFKDAMAFVGLPTIYLTEEGWVASKSYAEYQAKPNGSQQCDKCTMFRTPDRCSLVDGKIQPDGWCKYFEAKKEQSP